MHGESPIKRRESRKIWVGNVPVGGDAPIAVQSMTNSDTNDVAATVAQINRLEAAGVDIVRVSVPDADPKPTRIGQQPHPSRVIAIMEPDLRGPALHRPGHHP